MKTILYIFSGSRKKLLRDIENREAPDTQLYGMNHIQGDFQVETKEFSDTWLGRAFGRLIGFRLRHFFMYFYARSADIVFGSSLFYMLPLKRLFGAKGRFVVLNISLNRYLNQNTQSRILYKFSLNMLRSVDRIVSLSNIQNEELKSRHGIDPSKLAFVPLGVDVDFYKPVYSGRKNYILSAGRDNGRDYRTVIEVARRLPGREFHLVLSRRNLEGIEGIPSNVKIFYDISRMELRKKYAEAAMLLLTTYPDGYGGGSDCSGQTVLLEAFACGLPIIASRKAYIGDYAKEGEHLITVDFYDVSGIIDAIGKIGSRVAEADTNNFETGSIHSFTIGEEMSKRARLLVESKLSTAHMGRSLSELFKSI